MSFVDDIAMQCVDNINFYTLNKMPAEEASVLITTPKGWKAPPKFPRGEILIVKEDGRRVRRLPAMRLLAFLVGNNLTSIKLEMETLK